MAPIDEDAPRVAAVAADVLDVLNAATAPEVGYPGLDDVSDVESVLAALTHLAGNLDETAAQLARYLEVQLEAGRLAPAAGSSDEAAQSVATARDVLADVRDSAQAMALLLTRAEAAVLALQHRPASQ